MLARFSVTSKTLQASDTNLSTVTLLYGSLSEYVDSLRRETEFDIYENGALVKSEVTSYEDEMKRKRIRKLQPDETREGEIQLIGRENFKITTYNIILDTLSNEMKKRKVIYDELNLLFGFLINSKNEDPDTKTLTNASQKLCTLYNDDLPQKEDFVKECLHFFGFLKEF